MFIIGRRTGWLMGNVEHAEWLLRMSGRLSSTQMGIVMTFQDDLYKRNLQPAHFLDCRVYFAKVLYLQRKHMLCPV